MENLVKLLSKACDAYYNTGVEIMSNKEYDEKLQELAEMERAQNRILPDSPTRRVGADIVDSLPRFLHTFPAKSLDKTKSIDELVEKFEKFSSEACPTRRDVVVMWKEDGSTLQAYYNHGILQHLVTRGNGVEGNVITHNAVSIKGIPLHIPYTEQLVVRGEAVMSYKSFDQVNSHLDSEKKYKNPRNLASASIQLLDSAELAARDIHFIAFSLVNSQSELPEQCCTSFAARLDFLDSCGFSTVPRLKCPVKDLPTYLEKFSNDVASYDYPVDGLVCVLDDYAYTESLPGTEHHPHIMSGYALKWSDDTEETILRSIEWSPSRTGLYNPVAVFDPVELEGTTVNRASLHNISYVLMKDLRVGDRITVYKANKIIPQVDKNLDAREPDTTLAAYDIPTTCSKCHSPLRVKDSSGVLTLVCDNSNCPEKLLGNLVHFCSRDCMDIAGMSEETLLKLTNAGFVKNYCDLFRLDQKPAIAFIPGLGKLSWSNLVSASTRSRNTTFVKYISALSIPNIGTGQAKTLRAFLIQYARELQVRIADELDLIKLFIELCQANYDFSAVSGFGSSISSSLIMFVNNHMHTGDPCYDVLEYLHFPEITFAASADNQLKLSGLTFVVTGTLLHFSNRDQLVDVIESNGGKVSDSISAKTSYLITNDTSTNTSKMKKAKELRTPVISEKQFLSMIE